MFVRSVGIKRLKARLSEYVRLAKQGETVLVTERDTVVAELRPARHEGRPALGIEETLEAMAEANEARLAVETKKGWKFAPEELEVTANMLSAILDALRSDS